MTKDRFSEILNKAQNCSRANFRECFGYALEVAESGNPYFICDFAETVPMANCYQMMRILADGMLATNDYVHIYEFMFLMVDSNVSVFKIFMNEFEDKIIESGNPKLMYYLLGYVPGVNASKMSTVLYATKDKKYIQKYIEHLEEETIKEKDEMRIGELANELHEAKGYLSQAENYDFFPKCLEKYGTRDPLKLQVRVIQDGIPYYINEFAEYFGHCEGVDVSLLEMTMARIGDTLHTYEFMCSVEGANKNYLEGFVVGSGMAKYMYYLHTYLYMDDEAAQARMKAHIDDSSNPKYMDLVRKHSKIHAM